MANRYGVGIPAQKPKSWMGPAPTQCDLCLRPITQQFVNGKTRMGPWAIMCPLCYREHGVGLGTWRGQRYDAKTLEKIDG